MSPAAEDPPRPHIDAERFAGLALACVHRQYPNKIAHVMESDDDIAVPRELTPAFYGCFDWHSAVHGHWLLVRLVRTQPIGEFTPLARAAVEESLTEDHIAAEVAYIARKERRGFERPYGLAWLLQLAAELHAWDDPLGRRLAQAIEPLERLAAQRLREWIPKLSFPIRSGEHSQTAFAFGLTWDWAAARGDEAMHKVLRTAAEHFYADDRKCPIGFEPSGHDFLSPCLAEADFMRRILEPQEYAIWLSAALPQIPAEDHAGWLPIATPSDRSDGKLAHLDGLNLSRAWMLEGIASGLPVADSRVQALRSAASRHANAGLSAVTAEHYAGGHWLGSFAVYLTTQSGIAQRP